MVLHMVFKTHLWPDILYSWKYKSKFQKFLCDCSGVLLMLSEFFKKKWYAFQSKTLKTVSLYAVNIIFQQSLSKTIEIERKKAMMLPSQQFFFTKTSNFFRVSSEISLRWCKKFFGVKNEVAQNCLDLVLFVWSWIW